MSSFKCFLRYFQTRITTTKFKHITLTLIQILFFTLWSTPSFGMLLSKLSNRNTQVCTSSIRMISFFYPSVWIVHKLQCWEAGGVGWSTKCGQTWTGVGEVPVIPNCRHPLWMIPRWKWLSEWKLYLVLLLYLKPLHQAFWPL